LFSLFPRLEIQSCCCGILGGAEISNSRRQLASFDLLCFVGSAHYLMTLLFIAVIGCNMCVITVKMLKYKIYEKDICGEYSVVYLVTDSIAFAV